MPSTSGARMITKPASLPSSLWRLRLMTYLTLKPDGGR
jgi:hypothetical protein